MSSLKTKADLANKLAVADPMFAGRLAKEVADEYASRKFRELVKKNIINSNFVPPQMYKNVPLSQIRMMVDNYRKEMKSKDITSSEKISEYFYNMVKSNL
jgi:hypothetical protein